jgi:DNA-binding LacI/PurR family transcriptional regulator
VLGVNVLTYVDETAKDANDRTGVKTTQAMNVLNEGAVAMYVHGSVNPSTSVRVIHTATGVKYAGQFSSALISGKTGVLSNARYLSSVTGSGLAIVEFNGPSFTLTAD